MEGGALEFEERIIEHEKKNGRERSQDLTIDSGFFHLDIAFDNNFHLYKLFNVYKKPIWNGILTLSSFDLLSNWDAGDWSLLNMVSKL